VHADAHLERECAGGFPEGELHLQRRCDGVGRRVERRCEAVTSVVKT
jgi:hypothetical protein